MTTEENTMRTCLVCGAGEQFQPSLPRITFEKFQLMQVIAVDSAAGRRSGLFYFHAGLCWAKLDRWNEEVGGRLALATWSLDDEVALVEWGEEDEAFTRLLDEIWTRMR